MRSRLLPSALVALLVFLGGVGLLVSCDAADQAPPIDPNDPTTFLPNGRQPMDRVLTGGQPSPAQLSAIADAGYRTVVNLRPADEESPFEDERRAVETLGMSYALIPVDGAEGLTDENTRALSEVLADDTAYPLVIHCASGNRVGALIALEAAREEGTSPEQALELGLDAGLTRLEPAVRERLGLPAGE